MTAPDPDSANFVQQASQLDLTALSQIYDHFFPKIYRYCIFRLGSKEASDEACSEVFNLLLEILQQKPESIDDLETWFFDTANDVAETYLGEPPESISTTAPVQHNPTKPHDEIAWLANLVSGSLSRLVPEQQHLLALRFADPHSTDETARIMDRNIPEVKSLQSDALSILRRFLEEGS